MKINKIAAATLVPAALAGVAFTAVPFAQAAPAAPVAHAAAHHVVPARPAHRRAAHRTAAHHTKASATSSTTRPAQGRQATAHAQPGSLAAVAAPRQRSVSVTSDTFNPKAVSSFEQCVAWRESGNTATDPDGLFGILPYIWHSLGYSGTAGQAPVSQQQQAFDKLYAQYGSKPWTPSDGC
jgi:hypothetical protein